MKIEKETRTVVMLAICVSIIVFFAIMLIAPSGFFYVNDDPVIQAVLAGTVSGSPTPLAIFPNILVCLLPAKMFSIFPDLPWWYIAQEASLFISMLCFAGLVLALMPDMRVKFQHLLHASLTAIICFCFFVFPIGWPSYTLTSIMAASVGSAMCLAAWLVDSDFGRRKRAAILCIGILELIIAVSFRKMAGFYGIALVLAIALISMIDGGKNHRGLDGPLRFVFLPMMALLIMTTVVVQVNDRAYSGDEWVDFKKINSARSSYMDHAHDSYIENPAAYASVGWDEALYEITDCWFFMDPRDGVEEFTALTNQTRKAFPQNPIKALFRAEIPFNEGYDTASLAVFLALLEMGVLYITSMVRRIYLSIPIGAASVGILYLSAVGRLIARTLFCCVAPGIALIVVLLLYESHKIRMQNALSSRSILCVLLFGISLVLMIAIPKGPANPGGVLFSALLVPPSLFLCLRFFFPDRVGGSSIIVVAVTVILLFSGIGSVYQMEHEVEYKSTLSARIAAVNEYADNNPDCLFVASCWICNDDARIISSSNVLGWGGWEYYAPWRMKPLEALGFKAPIYGDVLLSDRAYYATADDLGVDVLTRYLESVTMRSVSAEIVARPGSDVVIYKFRYMESSIYDSF